MKTITIDGKEFEKVKVDFNTSEVGERIFGELEYEYEVIVKSRAQIVIKAVLSGSLYISDNHTPNNFYTLKEIKPPEVIESAWYECLIPDQGSMAGDIFCTSVSIINTKYYRKVKPINESCTMFEVVNE